MTNILHSLWRRRWLRVCVWIVVAIVVAIVSIRQYLDWSGARQWEAVQAMLAREGESLDIREIAPPPVPDDQNFCAIPALKDIVLWPDNDDDKSEWGLKRKRLMDTEIPRETKTDSKADAKIMAGSGTIEDKLGKMLARSSGYTPRPGIYGGYASGKAADMEALANWFRYAGWIPATTGSANPAQQLLAWQSPNDALVHELAGGLNRSFSQWTPAWKDRPLSEPLFKAQYLYYTPIQTVSSMLCFRSIVAARAGDAAKAHQSLEIAVRINQAALNDPLYISLLVSCGISSLVTGGVWELCDTHSGTDEEFRVLESELSKLDYHRGLLQAGRGEQAFSADTTRFLQYTSNRSLYFPFPAQESLQNRVIDYGLDSIPRGWLGSNLAILEQWRFEYAIKPLRDHGLGDFLEKQSELDALTKKYSGRWLLQYNKALALIAIPAMKGVVDHTIYAQSLVNEAIAACALERYRIEHGSYPDTLEAANHPGEPPIPLDVISGQPMHYRKTPNGMYALWCVGFDGKDDGGKRGVNPSNPDRPNFASPDYKGDWVWSFQPN